MEDERKTKKELIAELNELRQRESEWKDSQEEIRQARVNSEKYAKAFLQNSIPAAITTLAEGRYVDVSDAFLKFMECRRDEIIGHTPIEIGFVEEAERLSYLQKLKKDGRIENYEVKFRTKSGTLKHGLFNAVMMTLGNEKYLLSVLIDITDRKQAEEQLKEGEEKFRTLMESSPTALLIYQNNMWIYANPAATEITGYTYQELREMPIESFAHSADKEFLWKSAQMRQRGEISEKLHYEVRIIAKDGTVKWIDLSSTTISLNGSPAGIVSAVDITERKRMEKELQEKDDLLRINMDEAPDAVYMNDWEGKFIYANSLCERITGYRSEEFVGKKFDEINGLTARSLITALEMVRQSKMGKKPSIAELELIRKDGSIIPVEMKICVVLRNGKKVALGFFRDISSRKQVEEALRKSEAKYRSLIECSGDAIFCVDENGEFKFTNDVFASTLGKTTDYFAGKTFWDIFPKAHADMRYEVTKRVVLSGRKESIEVEVPRPDGTVYFLAKANPVRDENGKISQVLINATDVTSRKMNEEALRQAHERLMTVMDSLDALVYIADMETHEILFINKYGQNIWSNAVGKKCWQTLQKEQEGPCSFCTNVQLLTTEKASSGIYHWECLNTVTGRWFDCRDIAIQWTDGRMVRLEIATDITNRKNTEEELGRYREHLENMVKERTEELETKNISLQGLTTTLKVLLKQREDDKKDMEERFLMNVRNLVLPYVEQMKKGNLDAGQRSYLSIVETHLQQIATPLMKNLRQFNLTPKEIKVAALVRQGKPTKDIAEILGIAASSIDSHRKSIRNKIGLSDRKINLQTYLELLEH